MLITHLLAYSRNSPPSQLLFPLAVPSLLLSEVWKLEIHFLFFICSASYILSLLFLLLSSHCLTPKLIKYLHAFQNKWTVGRKDEWMDGWMDEWVSEWQTASKQFLISYLQTFPTQFCYEHYCQFTICKALILSRLAPSPKPQAVAFFWNALPLFFCAVRFYLSFRVHTYFSTKPSLDLHNICHCLLNYTFSSINAFSFPNCFVSVWILKKAILFSISQFA